MTDELDEILAVYELNVYKYHALGMTGHASRTAAIHAIKALIEKREVAARIDELVMAMREHPNDNFYERAHARLDQLQDGKDG